MTTAEVQQVIINSATKYGVDPNLALGVAAHESAFNPNAINTNNPNGTTDWGVMQLNDTTVQTMGVSNPLDPAQNIDAGVRLLSNLLNRYQGDSRQALWAYASGPGNVGPAKTPNSIAQNFINYVMGYNGGPATSSIPDDSGGFDLSQFFDSLTSPGDSFGVSEAGLSGGLLVGLIVGGIALFLVFRD